MSIQIPTPSTSSVQPISTETASLQNTGKSRATTYVQSFDCVKNILNIPLQSHSRKMTWTPSPYGQGWILSDIAIFFRFVFVQHEGFHSYYQSSLIPQCCRGIDVDIIDYEALKLSKEMPVLIIDGQKNCRRFDRSLYHVSIYMNAHMIQ